MRVGEARPPLDEAAVEPGGRKRDWVALMALSLSSLLRETPTSQGFIRQPKRWGPLGQSGGAMIEDRDAVSA